MGQTTHPLIQPVIQGLPVLGSQVPAQVVSHLLVADLANDHRRQVLVLSPQALPQLILRTAGHGVALAGIVAHHLSYLASDPLPQPAAHLVEAVEH